MNLLERYRKAVSDRSEWLNIYQEVGKYVWPNARTMVKSVKTPDNGQVLTTEIADSTAIKAALRMTSGIFSYLMPVGVKWFDLKPREERFLSDMTIARRASKATQSVHSAIWRSNFQREMFSNIRSLCVFGTGCISVELVGTELVFRNYHIADIFFEENSKGQIDTVFRRFFWTARQMVQEFGLDAVSEEVKKAYEVKNFTDKFECVHCVYPREDYDTGKADYKGMPFASEYYEVQSERLLKEGGFKRNPYRIGRFDQSPDELMGRSPAMDALPDIKMLNKMRYTFIMGSELQALPPLLVEDDSAMAQPVIGPLTTVYYRAGTQKPEPMKIGMNPQLTDAMIEKERQNISEQFYNDLFQALADYHNMTAYEVSQRVEEKLVMLAPSITGLQKGQYDPLIMDCYQLLIEGKQIEPIGVNVDITYQGRLALAMSNMQTSAIELTIAKWSPYQQFYPVLDNIDMDKAFRVSAINTGVPADVLRDEQDVEETRAEAKQVQRAAQMAEIAATGSQAIKNVQGTPLADMI